MLTKVSLVLSSFFAAFGGAGNIHAAPAPLRPSARVIESTCSGTYADAQLAMNPKVRDFENSGQARYVRLIRTEATYETLFYGQDGSVQRRRTKSVVYGTGLAYMKRDGDVYFLTNAHVATLPNVTTDNARVDGVPAGAKKVLEESRLVESDADDDYAHQVKLTRVVLDPMADAAILRAHPTASQQLPVMPYKIGKSTELRVGNFVYVRGYPLGVFQAVNVGRVTNAIDEDREQGWYHKDFIIDALLSSGNSGSPVFAVACKGGALELIGMYHAAYRQGSALNAVVEVGELRELMDTLHAPKRPPRPSDEPLNARDRDHLIAGLKLMGNAPFFPFAGGVAEVEVNGDALTLSILDRDFPASVEKKLWLVDEPSPDFGRLQRVGFKDSAFIKHEIDVDQLEAGQLSGVNALYAVLVRQLVATQEYRRAQATLTESEQSDHVRELQRAKQAQRDSVENAMDGLQDAIGDADNAEAALKTPQSH